jgi:hypothetical protein
MWNGNSDYHDGTPRVHDFYANCASLSSRYARIIPEACTYQFPLAQPLLLELYSYTHKIVSSPLTQMTKEKHSARVHTIHR